LRDPARLPKECHLVIDQGSIAGRVTSVVQSATLGKAVGLAMLAPHLAQSSGDITIRGEQGEMLAARIVPTPFYDPKNLRQRGGDAGAGTGGAGDDGAGTGEAGAAVGRGAAVGGGAAHAGEAA
jgi:hypothetical protein